MPLYIPKPTVIDEGLNNFCTPKKKKNDEFEILKSFLLL